MNGRSFGFTVRLYRTGCFRMVSSFPLACIMLLLVFELSRSRGRIGGTAMDTERLDHFYTFGDVYETLDACDALGILLSRLKRQNILTEPEWTQLTQSVANVRATVERKLSTAALTPKGPSLP